MENNKQRKKEISQLQNLPQ